MQIMTIVRHRLKTDGKGVTSLVGLSGCPLSCEYCLNKKALKSYTPRTISAEELLKEIMQDYCYFVATGGGVTFGGGEPLLQSDEILEFCRLLPPDIHVNIETALQAPPEAVLQLFPYVSEWIIDIKTMDPDIYLTYTGRDRSAVDENLKCICEAGKQASCRIRIPDIPSYTTAAIQENAADLLRKMGFENIDRFEYSIR